MDAGTESEARERSLRSLPSVDRLLATEPLRTAAVSAGHSQAVEVARRAVETARRRIKEGDGDPPSARALAARAAADLECRSRPSIRPVINATGVLVHTNLGRAPLARDALDAIERVARGYSNLEYDLEAGARGSRHAHVEGPIRELTGADAALAVNNNAAAVLLALAALARGGEVVVSRGQLVEIGGSFRIPEILTQSGARLVEVGTTNRTRLADFERAIGPDTAVLMRVHPSNFRTVGFTEEVEVESLVALARERGLTVIDDLGSGVLAERRDALGAVLADEPAARRSVAAGADVVCFSADKLLGGPQAGIAAGHRNAIELMRGHPLARALRLDKLSLAALEATLRLHRDSEAAAHEVPVLAMLSVSPDELDERARRLAAGVRSGAGEAADLVIGRSAGRPGGGALPLAELPGPVVRVYPREGGAKRLHARLRAGDPPLVARVHEGALVLDPRTIAVEDLEAAATAVVAALATR
jgi:L-seryl-tRNA(Ser) seleniumtransferase